MSHAVLQRYLAPAPERKRGGGVWSRFQAAPYDMLCCARFKLLCTVGVFYPLWTALDHFMSLDIHFPSVKGA